VPSVVTEEIENGNSAHLALNLSIAQHLLHSERKGNKCPHSFFFVKSTLEIKHFHLNEMVKPNG